VPYLKLSEIDSERVVETRESVVTLGRDPGATVVLTGPTAGVVSARHAEIRYSGGEWWLRDLGSRNGTYVNGHRIVGGAPLHEGDLVRLGESGPTLRVAAGGEALTPTVPEHPAVPAPTPAPPAETRPYAVTLIALADGRRFEAVGTRIRLGRGPECEVRPVGSADSAVSRVHAELTVAPTGVLAVRDAGSRNGTFLNGERIQRPTPIRLGDRLMLGPGGPTLLVDGIGTAPRRAAPPPRAAGVGPRTVLGLVSSALAEAREERRRGGRGSTVFFKALRGKIRWLAAAVGVVVVLVGGAVYTAYQRLAGEVALTERARHTADEAARAETARLRRDLAEARASAQARTTELEAALDRAQSALAGQLAAGETRRLEAQKEVERLRQQVAAAEARTATLEANLRAIRGVDFAAIAQQNQAAVGLITVAIGSGYFDGSGFVISPDGYMLTSLHVVADSARELADTVWVTLADETRLRLADIVASSPERDLALIRIRDYRGPHLTALDWNGTRARQGEPAALIGFPAGAGFARDHSSRAVRTSMSAGILSRVTQDLIQFDGMTTGGSSGSPVFNANGEVISIHRAGLRQGPGFALSVPVRYAVPLLPPALKVALGL
jgi:pSer/pThr/pTyr-binding forkhead associated (FHA) protein/S1-C subfamily serine protease